MHGEERGILYKENTRERMARAEMDEWKLEDMTSYVRGSQRGLW